jgi:hypothetical protein
MLAISAKETTPQAVFLTGRSSVVSPALPEWHAVRGAGPGAAAGPGGRHRTVVLERMVRDDFRNGLRVVPGAGPSGPGGPLRLQGASA